MTDGAEQASGGERVAAVLRAAGVDLAFGVLSVHNLPIYQAMVRGGIRVVPARSEQGAVGMADGYSRVTGRLGVALTSTGVGAANAAGPLLEAYAASSPLLHLTGQVDAAVVETARPALHAAKDQLGLLRSVGKGARRAARTEDVVATVAEAIRAARSGRPGPVSVEIPIDQQYRRLPLEPIPPVAPAAAPAPARERIEAAVDLLQPARRPLIWAGGGVISAGAAPLLRSLAERIGAGVLTTASGRGSLPEDHPLCIGNFALEPAVLPLLQDADVLLAVGTRLRGNETRGWQLPLPRPTVRIEIDPTLMEETYRADVALVGDARAVLQDLLDRLHVETPRDPGWAARCSEARRAVRESWRATLGPYERIMDDLRAALPRSAILVRDVTVHATAWGSRLLEVYEPRTSLHPATLAIGLGLPMAVGAAIAEPDRPVVLLAGDGGFAVALGELGTAVQEGCANLTIVLFNDAGYGILRNLQDAHFGGERFGADLQPPDFAVLGRSFGCRAAHVASSPELMPQLREALADRERPALLELDLNAIGPMAKPFTGAARLVPG